MVGRRSYDRDVTRVVVWNEFVHERRPGVPAELYPDGIHAAIADGLRAIDGLEVSTATLDEDEHGLPVERLEATDVLIWWGHLAHDDVSDEVAARVQRRVLEGMGLVVLHSGHHAKPFKLLMGTTCNLRWREADDRELVWVVSPAHPIAEGLPPVIELERHEMYGEFFDIPAPDELVLVSSFTGGEVFRSGCCFLRGKGRVFYFSPGHETYPIYRHPHVGRLLANAVRWAHNPAPAEVELEVVNALPGWFDG